MYGFGDDANPRQDSVELVEALMLEYLTDVVSGDFIELVHNTLDDGGS